MNAFHLRYRPMKPLSERQVTGIMWAAAVAALVLGVVSAATGVGALRERRERLIEKRGEMNELRVIESDIAATDAAMAACERLPERQATRLDDILRETLPDAKPEDVRETRHELSGGWMVRQREMAFSDVSLGDVLAMAHQAEQAGLSRDGALVRPPWRLSRLVFRGAPGASGRGRIVVQLDAVERP